MKIINGKLNELNTNEETFMDMNNNKRSSKISWNTQKENYEIHQQEEKTQRMEDCTNTETDRRY